MTKRRERGTAKVRYVRTYVSTQLDTLPCIDGEPRTGTQCGGAGWGRINGSALAPSLASTETPGRGRYVRMGGKRCIDTYGAVHRQAGPILLSLFVILGTAEGFAQSYPHKAVRIVAAEPGGIIDFAARLIAPAIAGPLGQPVIVDNRGSGTMQIEIVTKAPPDGYTLLIAGGALWAEALLRNTPFDPLRSLTPVSLITRSPNMVAVHPSLAVNSIKELVAAAKAKPGVLNYASSTSGTSSHLAAELFKSIAGIDVVRIPYKGTAAALNALVGGQVQFMFPNASAEPHRRSGRIKALAVTSAEPSALFPGLPSVAASLPGYESVSVLEFCAPANTPPAIVKRLSEEIARALQRPDVKEKLASSGAEAVGSTPEQLAEVIRTETARLRKLIADTGMRAE